MSVLAFVLIFLELHGSTRPPIDVVNCFRPIDRQPRVCNRNRASGLEPLSNDQQRVVAAIVAQMLLDRYGKSYADSTAIALKEGTAVDVVSDLRLRMPRSRVSFRAVASDEVAVAHAQRLGRRIGYVKLEIGKGDNRCDVWLTHGDGIVTNRTVPSGRPVGHWGVAEIATSEYCVRSEKGRLKVMLESTIVVDGNEERSIEEYAVGVIGAHETPRGPATKWNGELRNRGRPLRPGAPAWLAQCP